MSYPIDDPASVQEAVNDLLSGPSGLGQNFQGFSAYEPAFIRPTFSEPFTLPITTTLNPAWYVDIPISNITDLNPQQIEVTFTSAQPTAPFQFGDTLFLQNVTPDFFDGFYTVFSSTTTTLVLSSFTAYTWPAYVSGGNVIRDRTNRAVSADNNARITVLGPTDTAFVSSQIRLDVDYVTTGAADFRVRNTIERWRGYPVEGSTDYTFAFDDIVSQQQEDFSVSTSGSVPVEAIFTTVLDDPTFGYYWYFNNIYWLNLGGLLPSVTYGEYTVQGVSPIAATGAYTNVIPQTVTGTGSGADLDLFIYSTAYDVIFTDTNDFANVNFEVTTVNSGGTGYAVGDTIRILGTDVGGTSPDNDIVLRLELGSVDNPNACHAGNVVVGVRSMTAQVIKQ